MIKADIKLHILQCLGCQKTRPSVAGPALLAHLPIREGPNKRIHVDLFGLLQFTYHKKYVLWCMTDTFSKMAVMVPIPDYEATTMAQGILDHWVYRFAPPEQIHSDGGKEFVNQLAKELLTILDIKHTRTTPAHPQCNAQVDNFNRRIKDYLCPFFHATLWNGRNSCRR